jgi:hypothetical protein
MTPYEQINDLRYQSPWLQKRTETSVIKSAQYIQIEDPQTPDHANRLKWANWAYKNSSVAVVSFLWPVCLEPVTLEKGEAITDAEIDGIVSAALPGVVNDFTTSPPVGA